MRRIASLIRTIALAAALSGAGVSIAQTPPLDVSDPSITKKPTLDARYSRPPEYPLQAIKGRQQGEAKLTVCLNASGRVTSHTQTQSSGHKALDDATVDFLKHARFKPAEVDGKAVAVCGHGHTQIWNLNP